MDLYLQFGYGMMEHSRALLREWGGGTVVLSPRDLDPEQLQRLASDVHAIPSASVLLDPQFYLPHADHVRLRTHEYWPDDYDTGTFWQGQPLARLIDRLVALNGSLECRGVILPGVLATAIDEDWLNIHSAIIEEATSRADAGQVIVTLALSADALRSPEQIGDLLDQSSEWPVSEYYIVCEHPNGQYLVSDPNWVANVVDLVAGLRLQGRHVVLGYCNQQMLIAACAGANAVCSGTWMNVRSFPQEKFWADYGEEMKQRATWYYCPRALSEYKLPYLSIAYRLGVLEQMAPPDALANPYSAPLFAGSEPTSVPFPELAAFRHYLHCLRGQVRTASAAGFDATVANHRDALTSAETLLGVLRSSGVRAQNRDFTEAVDASSSALTVLERTRGALLRRKWSTLA